MPIQKGVGEGTVTRLRRTPRARVDDVAITEASGLTLGPDGYPHPLETTPEGEVKALDQAVLAVLEDMLLELHYMREGMILNGLIFDVESI